MLATLVGKTDIFALDQGREVVVDLIAPSGCDPARQKQVLHRAIHEITITLAVIDHTAVTPLRRCLQIALDTAREELARLPEETGTGTH